MRAILLAASLTLVGLAGCATPSVEEGKPAEARVYVTGSNIARRPDQPTGSPTQGISGDEMRKGRASIVDLTSPNASGEGQGQAPALGR